MVEADERVVFVHDNADRVEAQGAEEGPVADLVEPDRGHPPHLRALRVVEVVPRLATAGAAGLHLAEDERVAVRDDEVELAEARAVVAREDPAAETEEVLRSELLAEPAEALVGVRGHGRMLERGGERNTTRMSQTRAGSVTKLCKPAMNRPRAAKIAARCRVQIRSTPSPSTCAITSSRRYRTPVA